MLFNNMYCLSFLKSLSFLKMRSNQATQRERVYEFYLNNKDKGKMFTVNHFLLEKIARSTIYSIIKRAENESGHARVQGSGRIAKKMPKKRVEQPKTTFNNQSKISYRSAGRKFKISHSYVHFLIKNKSNIKKRTKQTIPDRSSEQQISAKTKCSRLYSKFSQFIWILDDESYFTLKHSTVGGNNIFYTDNVDNCPNSVKYSRKSKFEKKVLVWIAVSQKGISSPFIRPSGLAINQDVYLNDCIKKRLLPFIEKYHKEDKIVFWPDLAPAHYAKKVQNFLVEKKINFVLKEDNPANIPEARPIELFWGILKAAVYKDGWEAENLDQLVNRIKYCLSKIDPTFIHNQFSSVKGKIDSIRRHGVIETR